MSNWRMAYGIEQLRKEINTFAPNRGLASEGGIGDTSHSARKSDHNPNSRNVVQARDFTHDPKGGFDSYIFAKALAQTNDPRIKYIISNGKIWTPSVSKSWRNYTGSNPHDHHVHVSISDSPSLYDNTADWKWEGLYEALKGAQPTKPDGSAEGDRPAPDTEINLYPVLRKGSKGEAVKTAQQILAIKADSDFGPATERAVRAFQLQRGLTADGVIGPDTWRALRGATALGKPETAPSSTFARVMEWILVDEGSELNISSHEPGGASRYGVSIDALTTFLKRKATVQDLKAMSPATVAQVYRTLYADPIGFDKLPVGLNYAALDFGINSGIAHVDGKDNMAGVKDAVTEALKETGIENQINKLCDLRLEWMKSLKNYPKYKNGWTARLDRVRNRSINMAK